MYSLIQCVIWAGLGGGVVDGASSRTGGGGGTRGCSRASAHEGAERGHHTGSHILSVCRCATQCYKAVPVLMDKQLRKAQGAERLNIMYAVSKLLRLAKRELKNKSKYGECSVCVWGGWQLRKTTRACLHSLGMWRLPAPALC